MNTLAWISAVASLTTLSLVAWQVARLEGVQPVFGWHTDVKRDYDKDAEMMITTIASRLMGAAALYEVTIRVPGAEIDADGGEPLQRRAVVTARDEPIASELCHPSKVQIAFIVEWVQFSKVRRRISPGATRIVIPPTGAVIIQNWRSKSPLGLGRPEWVTQERIGRFGLPTEVLTAPR